MDIDQIKQKIDSLGPWYHKIDLGGGIVTPSIRNQGLIIDLYREFLPEDFTGMRVLDLGANAGGLAVEFAKRGADVVAIEHGARYVKQALFVAETLGLSDKINVVRGDLFSALDHGTFDIVCYVGLAYHIRYPQLALDMLSWICKSHLITSTQTLETDALVMENRAASVEERVDGELWGWNIGEELFRQMIMHAGFKSARLVSTRPHRGETPKNKLANRSYYYAAAGEQVDLPFISKGINTKPRHKYLGVKLGIK